MSLKLRRRSEDRGAAVVEAALVAPVFFMVVFAIFEFGLVYRDVLTVSDAAGNGARNGAVVGPRILAGGGNADFAIIQSVRNGLGSIKPETVASVVVFRSGPPGAGGPLAQVPAACRSGSSVNGLCNVYDPHDAFLAIQNGDRDYFDCSGGSGPACFWRPTSRSNGPSTYDIDYLGVYVRVNRPYVTGLFGDAFTFEHAEVVRLEPGVIE